MNNIANKKKIRQNDKLVLRFIVRYIDRMERPPTVREIMAGTGLYASTSPVAATLRKLEEFGYIERTPGISRGIKIVKEFDE